MKKDFSIKENSWIARIAAWKLNASQVALVIGKTIHLHRTGKEEFFQNKRWLLHEMKHLEQFRRYGLVRFIFLYTWESLQKGYYNNRFEVEARMAEKD